MLWGMKVCNIYFFQVFGVGTFLACSNDWPTLPPPPLSSPLIVILEAEPMGKPRGWRNEGRKKGKLYEPSGSRYM